MVQDGLLHPSWGGVSPLIIPCHQPSYLQSGMPANAKLGIPLGVARRTKRSYGSDGDAVVSQGIVVLPSLMHQRCRRGPTEMLLCIDKGTTKTNCFYVASNPAYQMLQERLVGVGMLHRNNACEGDYQLTKDS